MKPSEYQDWMKQAFLSVEAKVGTELIQSTGRSITEEHIRDAMVKGMKAACPGRAIEVDTEWDTLWSSNVSWLGTGAKAGGRGLQHDIVVKPKHTDPGLVCEVKWLKTTATEDIIEDIWKLILTRSTTREQSAMRTFLLIGGEALAFRATLENVKRRGPYLKWSQTNGRLPERHIFGCKRLINEPLGYSAFEKLIGWGAVAKRDYRTPPAVLKQYTLKSRATWLRHLGLDLRGQSGVEAKWHAALWEITTRSASKRQFSWAATKAKILANKSALANANGAIGKTT